MIKAFIITGVATLSLELSALALAQESSGPANVSQVPPANVSDPVEFATKASIGNVFEVKTSALALARTKNKKVAALARVMVEDHPKGETQLQSAAKAQDSLSPPVELDAVTQDKYNQLEKATGPAFDELYVKLQTEAHVEAVALFSGFAEEGPAGPLKDFAKETLPTLRTHYAMVKVVAATPSI